MDKDDPSDSPTPEKKEVSGLVGFWQELRRRKVMRVGITYAAVAWLIIQIAATTFEGFGIPLWAFRFVTIMLGIGFPIAVIIAWAFELTPDGIKTTKSARAERGEKPVSKNQQRKLNWSAYVVGAIIPTLIFGVLALIFYFRSDPSSLDPSPTSLGLKESDKSIAVLPFDNRSELKDDAFFTDGIHAELLARISKISDIKTTSRTSVEVYRDSPKNMKTIGEELGVATILEGGVQRAGDQIRINVQLIDAATDAHLWAEIYTREIITAKDIFTIQTEIATTIARSLKVVISPEEQKRIEKIPTENLEALEAYFRGREIYESDIQTRKPEAVKLLERAVELDPEFALAHVYLCWAGPLWSAGASDKIPNEERLSEAEPIAERALELDDELSEVHLLWADIHRLRRRTEGDEENNRALEKKSIERAIELDPNSAVAKYRYGEFLNEGVVAKPYADRIAAYRAALPWFQEAAELDPRGPAIARALGGLMERLGNFQDARIQYESAIQMNPSQASAYRVLGFLIMTSFGRYDEAIPILRQGVELDPLRWEPRKFLSFCYQMLGDNQEALRWQKTSTVSSWGDDAQGQVDNYTLWVNERDKWLEQARSGFHEQSILNYPTRRPLLNDDIRNGRAAEALERYQAAYPFLFEERFQAKERPELRETDRFRYMSVEDQALLATELGEILLKLGNAEQAKPLLNAGWEAFKEFPRMGWWFTGYRRGHGIRDVVRYALLGQKRDALDALREAINVGFRDRIELESSALDSLRDDPEFIAIMEEVEADWSRQLANVRGMEVNGELARIPEIIRVSMEE